MRVIKLMVRTRKSGTQTSCPIFYLPFQRNTTRQERQLNADCRALTTCQVILQEPNCQHSAQYLMEYLVAVMVTATETTLLIRRMVQHTQGWQLVVSQVPFCVTTHGQEPVSQCLSESSCEREVANLEVLHLVHHQHHRQMSSYPFLCFAAA